MENEKIVCFDFSSEPSIWYAKKDKLSWPNEYALLLFNICVFPTYDFIVFIFCISVGFTYVLLVLLFLNHLRFVVILHCHVVLTTKFVVFILVSFVDQKLKIIGSNFSPWVMFFVMLVGPPLIQKTFQTFFSCFLSLAIPSNTLLLNDNFNCSGGIMAFFCTTIPSVFSVVKLMQTISVLCFFLCSHDGRFAWNPSI